MERLALKNVGNFYGHLVYFAAISYIIWPFGMFCGRVSRFGMLYKETSGNPAPRPP
jgi:hypothetical protein